ncbi:hypothetical protein [Halobacterium salinarum]|uniref:hypothetical protein n=1 Tax=Halobacterium salinarum TaxID=2242 RepID=UPI00255253AF|nr:hypothetical protein [Halobacterium salinarum]MDL0133513.1 hypothetical protein [Halobacterium salinarum]
MTNSDNYDLRVSARTCRLTAGTTDDEADTGPPYRFGGIAVAAGDVLHMDDGTRVLMTAEELSKAADTQANEPLTKDHPEDDQGRPKYPPEVDETFGKVPKAGWVDDQEAVAYEATTHDETIGTGVQAGSYDVSVHPFFGVEPYDGDEADVKAVDINFADLSVVSKGDSPSATAEFGRNEALASYTASADIGAELTAVDDVEDAPADERGLVEKLARKMGIIGDHGDRRGAVWFTDQTSDGSTVTLQEARFADARWLACAHLEGDVHSDIGPGLGEAIGEGPAFEGDEVAMDVDIPLADELEEDATVYVALHYADDAGDAVEPITAADGGFFWDSAFVGVAPDAAEVTADKAQETTEAESSTDSPSGGSGNTPADGGDSDSLNMDDNTRSQYESFLTANAGFDDDSVSGMSDDVLKQTYELAAEGAGDSADNDGGSTDDDTDDKTLGEMTPAEAKEALEEQGFVTQDNFDEATAQISKSEKVDEIIANSSDYEDGDRQELMASADKIVNREHDRVTGGASQVPGMAGLTASAEPQFGSSDNGDEEDLDDYGTGVAEH